MSGSIIKIKRRSSTGQAGAPASLKAGELAFNENASDKILYYGYGDDGSGTATSVIGIGGEGAFATLGTNQTVTGNKTFSGTVTLTGATVSLLTSQLTESGSLFFSNARARAAITGSSTVSFNQSTGQISLPDDLTIASGLTVGGNLTVNGTLTTVNSTTVTVDDKNLELGSTASPTDVTADGGGITLKGDTDKTIQWLNATDSWTFNQSINITTGGLRIGGTEVITSSRVLTNVTISGITIDGGEF
jgi:hypothetical protein